MNTEYTLLLAGSLDDNHIIRFVRNLKQANPHSRLFFIGLKTDTKIHDQDYLNCYESVFLLDIYKNKCKLPVIRSLMTLFYWRKQFRTLLYNKHFDIVNIHYPSFIYFFVLDLLKSCCHRIVLTPWGSDVYRISRVEKVLLKRIYKASDYVTGGGDRFTSDFMKLFKIPSYKFKCVHIGSETIDYIEKNNDNISPAMAKEIIGISNHYVITCGYNASEAQNHLDIIKSIIKIKDKIPSPFILLFPMTYPSNKEYVEKIKNYTSSYNLNTIYFEHYLDASDLFYLIQATDLFIHVQKTDANSTSLREYLLCGKKVINGSWLRYSDIETDDCIPYYLVDNLENLDSIIIKAIEANPISIPDNIISVITSMGCKTVAQKWNDLFTSIS